MKSTKFWGSLGLVSAAALTLAACGKGGNSANTDDTKQASKFSPVVPKKATKEGGTVKQAIETDTPFTGIFANELSTTQTDADVMEPGLENLFDVDDDYRINDKGPATMKIDRKNNTVTIVVKKGVKWSDGKQVVAKDLEFSYEIMANKATKSQRYTSSIASIKGMKEYHDGKAKTISGLEMPDGENGRKLIIHYDKLKPGMYNSGNGYFSENAQPYHYLKKVPFSKLESSDQIRKKPMFFGPYKVDKVVRGQSVTWSPNKYYWRGKPKLTKVICQVVSTKSASQAIKSQKFDIASVINSQWKQVKDTKGVNFVAKIPLEYSYLGFKVGKWDAKKGKNVMNPNAKMNNKSLRKAIAYAMNISQATKRYTGGLTFQIPTLIPAQFGDFFDKDAKGYDYNLKKANELLDKAGYKKKGKWRVQPNGKPLKIKILVSEGSDPSKEPITQNYLQQWHKIGLNVSLINNRLIEFNSYVDKVQNDDPEIDMFTGAWSLSSEPSPNDLYGEGAPFDFTRFVTPENSKLLDAIDSEKAFDHKYRVEQFHKWQEYMNEEAYCVPMTNSYSITAVNGKLTGYSVKPSDSNDRWFKVAYAK
ncbi:MULTISPECIES: oligopeptide ABC transporter substrate-binding protein [Lactobacillus]|uniref:oligopeptide ABC transporter substrate-binding protein n=1 Tax=Lactobacillus TaxID=1578 RepID=UPI001C6A78D9|nr:MULTISPECIES: oligopeptide ABC transporter substrate-binding protein [Lactobacillus]MCX8721707.1 oligopeptide ABC transporter substrate-binding protein [Lactobacillus sp. B4010]MCX8732505.1 oligopeptide ABC transporter substrate-binding protein [Lactobacillus sp. B4015]MCX8734725.1 oligopeptide ABC transporter substrate-binding protein [Lactobacillus sp. B4012]QYN56790.1 oligopeptide ABC transporter substrate-binding protein [Lactobacillus panisapium]